MNKNIFALKTLEAVRPLFDLTYSPLRIWFHADDPAKSRALDFVQELQSQIHDLGDEPTIMIRTEWLDAYKLLAGSFRVGIRPFFDRATGQVRISGYELVEAGIINESCIPMINLTADEREAGHLSDPPILQEAINAVMSVYLANLGPVVIETADRKLAYLYSRLTMIWRIA